jgi:tetratricopeptide (TPR) repeat protein
MNRESLVFAVSGTAFGLLVGWMIGTQKEPVTPPAAPVAAAAPSTPAPPAPPPLDEARVAELEKRAAGEPRNADLRLQIANLYFDSDRVDQAAPWYEAALAIDPGNANANTDLGLVYFYQGQADRALAQIDRALAVEPAHLKALLSQGVIRWQGKQDLVGAAESWEKVVAAAPDSEEARTARMGLEGLKGRAAQPAPATPQ